MRIKRQRRSGKGVTGIGMGMRIAWDEGGAERYLGICDVL